MSTRPLVSITWATQGGICGTRAAATAMILLAVCAAGSGMAAENANDVSFTLTTLRNPAVYRVGEWIEISAAYSAPGPGYCLVESGGALRDQISRQSQDEFNVVPLDNVGSVSSAPYDPYFDKGDFNPSSIKMISKLSSVHCFPKSRAKFVLF
jgi:hypothetical protein